jgi:malonyl-CoA O-methyltransferase
MKFAISSTPWIDPMPPLDKQIIADNFSRAASTYDAWAEAHREIAHRLAAMLHQKPHGALDLGCGTGILATELLQRFPGLRLHGIDLAPVMIARCRERWAGRPEVTFAVGDLETSHFPFVPDLIASSCAFQWLPDLSPALASLYATLQPGGRLAFAELAAGSLPELRETLDRLKLPSETPLIYRDPDNSVSDLLEAGFRLQEHTTGEVTVWHADARTALKSFKGIGAVFTGHPGHRPLAPRQIRDLLQAYAERFANSQGQVPVTYRAAWFVASKETSR